MKKYLVGEEYLVTHRVMKKNSGQRLDRFLMDRYRRRSREQLKRAIEVGAITVERQGAHHPAGKIKPSFCIQDGDLIRVLSKKRAEPEVNFDYQILYEDEDILVVDKPPNLPVHPAGRFFFNTLLIHLKTRGFQNELESERTLFLVHRIDKETSGILLLAKSKEACFNLTDQFKFRKTDKYYLAIVKGTPHAPSFDVNQPLGKIKGSRIGLKMYLVPEAEGGQSALTHFETIETRTGKLGTFSLVACFPRTGRQHQIRVHAEASGIPLVGDKLYGLSEDAAIALLDHNREDSHSTASPEPILEEQEVLEENLEFEDFPPFEIPDPTSNLYAETEAKLLIPRHALHAAGLRFTHPRTLKEMVFESPFPKDLLNFFERLEDAKLAPFRTKHW